MSESRQTSPPKWATRLLAWYCKPELLEDLQGDLNEYFDRNVKSKGVRWARWIYIIDVLKFFRLYTVRKPEFLDILIHLIMIESYIKTSGRSIVRNKLFSAINIVGLAISMSVGLLIIAMMTDLLKYDRFHDKHARIFRVISHYQFNGRTGDDFNATTSLKSAKAIKQSFTGVEDVAILRREFSGDLTFGEKAIPLSGFWANEAFFKVFSFQLIHGNPATALKEPFSILLTEKSALKLFGNTHVVGKIVTMNDGSADTLKSKEYTITGIVRDLPVFSHIKFDMLGSLATREVVEADNKDEMAWDNVWHWWTYILLPEGAKTNDVERNLTELSEKEDATVPHTKIKLALQPLDDIMLGDRINNEIGPTMGSTVVWVFGCLSFIVVLSAGLNYTNLSIARSFRRSREVGIRKTIGALKGHVVNQFIVESIIIALIALAFAFGLFLFIRPHFLSIENSLKELLVLELTPTLIALFILFAVAVGICAGIFPAIFFSRINAVQVLKNLSAIPLMKGVTLRKALIVFQYCISIIAITATLIIHKQYNHFIAYDLGFTTENILNIRLQGTKAALLKKEMLELPEVKGVSQSSLITSIGSIWGTTVVNPNDPLDSTGIYFNIIDENYLPLHDHELIAGRNFESRTGKIVESEVIVNEEVLKRFNITGKDPAKAIGEVLKVDRKPLTIIGVIKNFEYGRANNTGHKEVMLRYSADEAQYLNVKILSSNWPETFSKIESIWRELDTVHPLEAKFYDEQIEDAFQGLKASMKVGSFLAFLIICIASIGLLGMVIFSTETRLKEVSIRKVFGASEARLLFILSKGFLILLLIAAAIGLPLTYLFFDKVLLPEIANHAPLGVMELLIGVLAVMIIALFMICTQTLKVARANPAEVLKTE